MDEAVMFTIKLSIKGEAKMIIEFSCKCGADSPHDAIEYDGALGYEAIVCKRCARYCDWMGEHEADEWSRDFIKSLTSC
jgi:hypothetical protein